MDWIVQFNHQSEFMAIKIDHEEAFLIFKLVKNWVLSEKF
jgi:hypothetical protein